MENQENNIENKKVSTIENIKQNYEGVSLFPLGSIENVTYSDLGDVLILEMSGDVPTNFIAPNIVIVHPNAERDGWIGRGKIGLTLAGGGVPIEKIPLTSETVKKIQEIYQEYTGKENRDYFYREDDANKFAVMGAFNDIVEKAERPRAK